MSTKKSSLRSAKATPAKVSLAKSAVHPAKQHVLQHHAHVIQHSILSEVPLSARIQTEEFKPEDIHEFVFEDGGVGEVRELHNRVYLKPRGERALYLVAFGDLSNQAQNALLKVLEDPPSHAVIVLGVPSPRTLIPTILSRVQILEDAPIVELFDDDAHALLSASLPQRLTLLTPYIENRDVEKLCSLIEKTLSVVQKMHPANKALIREQTQSAVLTVQYLRMQGSMVKMLAEAWALTLPVA